jgi:predicted component of type VI protein secretion system
MRCLPSFSFLVAIVLVGTGAHAQSAPQSQAVASPPQPAAASKEPVKDIHAQTEAWFKDCKQGWDAATHMSRRDYERTCLRMAQERIKFMRDWENTSRDQAKAK